MSPVCCPGCTRRGTMKARDVVWSEAAQVGDIASWQCVYCGAVCEQDGPKTWKITRHAPVVLQPGELAAMRDARAKRQGRRA